MKVVKPPSSSGPKPGITVTDAAKMAFGRKIAGDKYLHYDQLRHRVSSPDELDTLWWGLHFSRMLSAKWLDLKFDGDTTLTAPAAKINTTSLMQKSCSIVDRLTTSAAEAERHEKFNADNYLMTELTAAESIASSQLEGAATTSRVALEMIKLGRHPRDNSEKMIMGNYHLMQYIASRGNKPFDIKEILHLQSVAVAGIDDERYSPGELRRNTDDVVVVDHEQNVLHTPIAAEHLESALKKLCVFINIPHESAEDENYLHPLVKAAIIHFMVGYLHPFRDGNGRTARALFYWYMLKCGYSAFRYISISKLLKNAPSKYVKAYLYTETDELDLTYFVDYQCEIVSRAVKEYTDYIKDLLQTRGELASWLYSTGIAEKVNSRQLALATTALQNPGVIFTAAEVSQQMNVSDNTARDDLKKLTELGLMRSMKEGKGNVYLSPKSLKELKKWSGDQGKTTTAQDW